MKTKAFTLIELLVVVAVIGILAAVSPFKWHCGFNLVVQIRVGFIDLLSSKFDSPSEHFIISDCINLVIVLC